MTHLMEKARSGRNAALASLPVDASEFISEMERRNRPRTPRPLGTVRFVSKRAIAQPIKKIH